MQEFNWFHKKKWEIPKRMFFRALKKGIKSRKTFNSLIHNSIIYYSEKPASLEDLHHRPVSKSRWVFLGCIFCFLAVSFQSTQWVLHLKVSSLCYQRLLRLSLVYANDHSTKWMLFVASLNKAALMLLASVYFSVSSCTEWTVLVN